MWKDANPFDTLGVQCQQCDVSETLLISLWHTFDRLFVVFVVPWKFHIRDIWYECQSTLHTAVSSSAQSKQFVKCNIFSQIYTIGLSTRVFLIVPNYSTIYSWKWLDVLISWKVSILKLRGSRSMPATGVLVLLTMILTYAVMRFPVMCIEQGCRSRFRGHVAQECTFTAVL